MIFRWLRERRRRAHLSTPPPEAWDGWLSEDFAHWRALTDDERARLMAILRVLLMEKQWEGCGGLELTERATVGLAAQAGLLLLCLEHDHYRNVDSVLVYPSGYVIDQPDEALGHLGATRATPVLGHASHGGPVVLSWDAAFAGGRDPTDGRNLVYHEFAHKLDLLDGVVDGTPPLAGRAAYRNWHETMTHHYEALRSAVHGGKPHLMDAYGATNVGEFFAVATETFFEKPRRMQREAPALYAALADFYRQDPATRPLGRGRAA